MRDNIRRLHSKRLIQQKMSVIGRMEKVELIDGQMYMMVPPSRRYQEIRKKCIVPSRSWLDNDCRCQLLILCYEIIDIKYSLSESDCIAPQLGEDQSHTLHNCPNNRYFRFCQHSSYLGKNTSLII